MSKETQGETSNVQQSPGRRGQRRKTALQEAYKCQLAVGYCIAAHVERPPVPWTPKMFWEFVNYHWSTRLGSNFKGSTSEDEAWFLQKTSTSRIQHCRLIERDHDPANFPQINMNWFLLCFSLSYSLMPLWTQSPPFHMFWLFIHKCKVTCNYVFSALCWLYISCEHRY